MTNEGIKHKHRRALCALAGHPGEILFTQLVITQYYKSTPHYEFLESFLVICQCGTPIIADQRVYTSNSEFGKLPCFHD